MNTTLHNRHLRSTAWAVTLRRLRQEYPEEHRQLMDTARYAHTTHPTQAASTELRRRHPERAAEIYREEVVARGLPAPGKRLGVTHVQ